ncbi:CDP-alcohol phosphatidyltransferase family protein [Verticiella alkaliphila]|uniref:CDP-alcohol phosphatidyltransferase family protein n=1 Tax=Verticiella alkaliphila TaxID=2779529 RepID=UPI001C0A9F10|nr:CDP-alcohol phosphatidyltransferase family protein [Verticiella sp. GG226]
MRASDHSQEPADRRPLASRGTRWAQGMAAALLKTPATPNGISATGIGFAAAGGLAFAFAPQHPWLFLVGALLVQARLLCNLLDGMVAVEGGRGSPTGALYNEIPDRFEDSFLLIGFGYASGVPEFGFIAALLAVLTAYLRAFGASLGLGQDFRGPMAKPQRMAALTIGAVLALLEVSLVGSLYVPIVVMVIVVIGTAWTCWRRIARMAGTLRRPS